MKQQLLEKIQAALDTRKKNGDPIFDQDLVEVSVPGTFAGDKFIVIKMPKEKEVSVGDPNLKGHHVA